MARKRWDTATFIEAARKKHGDKYDYSRVRYKSMREPVVIICPVHGEFTQKPLVHLSKDCAGGCRQCAYDKRRLSTQVFVERAKKVHGERYDYSKTRYHGNNRKKVTIICPEHGAFEQEPCQHLLGRGCPQCGYRLAADKRTKSIERRLADFRRIHGDVYEYDVSTIGTVYDPMRIKCPVHGWFEQLLMVHRAGSGCPQCGADSRIAKHRRDADEFIRKAIATHGSKYDYSRVDYTNSYTPVMIVCQKHGPFMQRPSSHLRGSGCPSCSVQVSSFEDDMKAFLGMLGVEYKQRLRGLLPAPCTPRHEVDFYLPECGVAIECHGTMWHSSAKGYPRYAHERKAVAAESAGIRLLQIFSHDWYDPRTRPVLEDIIRRALGKYDVSFGARECSVRRLRTGDVRDFLEENHHRGSRSGRYYALFRGEEMCAVFGAAKRGDGWVVVRYCTKLGYRVHGAFGKLFKAFVRDVDPQRVDFFVDRLLFVGGADLSACGFVQTGEVRARYFYVDGAWRYAGDRRAFQKKKLQRRFPEHYDEKLTEEDIAARAGYWRVYDAGYKRLTWTPPCGI